MEKLFTIYNNVTGRIIRTGRWDDILIMNLVLEDYESVIPGKYNPGDYYVDIDDKQVHIKQIINLTIENGTLKNIPDGSIMYIKELDKIFGSLEGSQELELPEGDFKVFIHHPHYYSKELTLSIKDRGIIWQET